MAKLVWRTTLCTNSAEPTSASTLLALDPSINRMGWAVGKAEQLLACGTLVHSSKEEMKKEWYERALLMCAKVELLLRQWSPQFVLVELPGFWGGQERKGEMFKLFFCIGAIVGTLHTRGDLMWAFAPVELWKGQQNKEVTRRRIMRRCPNLITNATDHNATDAAGILLWFFEEKNT